MIDTIIFDFGDVFINLDYGATERALEQLGIKEWNSDLDVLNKNYEVGKIDELAFIEGLQKHTHNADLVTIREAWNALLLDFPLYRLEFLQMISSKYRLFLLSNTDSTHIDKFEHKVGQSFARDFYGCFEKVYFSFEIGKRKPDENTYKYIIGNHNLVPKKTLFVDDKLENIEGAKKAGLQTWHLNPKTEDVTSLLEFIKNI
ncbi:MAG: haloacid dehalogenase [Flavobacterium sp.]|uniref:HAD family hydrolase n=1 Tax=unclassified Flavobacterium TaxID=196869 RepID=UPI000C39D6E9|nr:MULTISPECIES: HAD family phosphatase [unclassified Flavobacterium]MBF02936.1 haloacid dehalogenase [Flavobacterium sp.]MCO6162734.1 HAD family phosphatase [Flavobacterium sp. NRK F7]|tara:strand:- start:1221 stop:1826 length:606 start_codon:yes stop_codon:yes gene_type:complete